MALAGIQTPCACAYTRVRARLHTHTHTLWPLLRHLPPPGSSAISPPSMLLLLCSPSRPPSGLLPGSFLPSSFCRCHCLCGSWGNQPRARARPSQCGTPSQGLPTSGNRDSSRPHHEPLAWSVPSCPGPVVAPSTGPGWGPATREEQLRLLREHVLFI